MSGTEERMEGLQGRGCGVFFLAAPVVMFLFVVVAYGHLAWYGLSEREPEGDPAILTYQGCEEARGVVQSRVDLMGFAGVVDGIDDTHFRVRMVMPEEERVAAQLPQTLMVPGVFEVRDESGEEVLLASRQVLAASPRLDLLMNPSLVVEIPEEAARALRERQEAAPQGQWSYWLDGVRISGQKHLKAVEGNELEVVPPIDDEQQKTDTVAAWWVAVAHPLPCPVTWISTELEVVEAEL